LAVEFSTPAVKATVVTLSENVRQMQAGQDPCPNVKVSVETSGE